MKRTITIKKLHKDLGFALADSYDVKDVFISVASKFSNKQEFKHLEIGDKLKVSIVECERGLFAYSINYVTKAFKEML